MSKRLTPERLGQLRARLSYHSAGDDAVALLAELDAVTRERDCLADAAIVAVDWFARFAAGPEDTTVIHGLQAALGQAVEHHPRHCRCDA